MSDATLDDGVLIRKALGGDRSAFDALIARHEKRAYQYAFRLTSNADEAADIVSEAFVRVYGALANFRGGSAFTTWLYRILTNCYLDSRKRDKSKMSVSLEQSLATESGEVQRQVVDPGEGPEAVAERDARENAVQSALKRLPEYQQAMLVMFHVEMLTYEEIAESLDLPLGTVKSRMNRARLSLREFLVGNEELFGVD